MRGLDDDERDILVRVSRGEEVEVVDGEVGSVGLDGCCWCLGTVAWVSDVVSRMIGGRPSSSSTRILPMRSPEMVEKISTPSSVPRKT